MSRRRLVCVLALSLAVLGAAACSNVIGIQDVQLKGSKGTTKKDGGEPIDEPGPDPDEEDAATPANASTLQVALGAEYTCARKPEGTVSCWGDDAQGQTGGGSLAPGQLVNAPQPVTGITDAVDLSAGAQHACVARGSGAVSCWGFNLDGQLGNGETANRKPAPVDVSGLTNAFAVAAGGNFTCALRGSGSVACWGGNGSGQLGKGDDAPSATPVAVPGLAGVVAIAAGRSHVCAVKSTGTVSCWGDGADGQLGRAGGSASPVPVEGVTDAVAIAAGERWSCAVTSTGAVLCWGANEHGQLGDGTTTASTSPVSVTSLSDAVAISAGGTHTCATRKSGAVVCWGGGGRGQLGDGKTRGAPDAQSTFVLADGVTDAVGVGAGGEHTCAARSGQILCWGANDRGQLGNSGTGDTTTPMPAGTLP